jgi:hypothetical protein
MARSLAVRESRCSLRDIFFFVTSEAREPYDYEIVFIPSGQRGDPIAATNVGDVSYGRFSSAQGNSAMANCNSTKYLKLPDDDRVPSLRSG